MSSSSLGYAPALLALSVATAACSSETPTDAATHSKADASQDASGTAPAQVTDAGPDNQVTPGRDSASTAPAADQKPDGPTPDAAAPDGAAPEPAEAAAGQAGAADEMVAADVLDAATPEGQDAATVSLDASVETLPDGSQASGAPGDAAACQAQSYELTPATDREAVTMYVVLDNSNSMQDEPLSGETKWAQAIAAVTEFVRDPRSKGLGLGLQYFHPEPSPALREELQRTWEMTPSWDRPAEPSYRPDKCDGAAHAQSAFDVGRLPEVADAVVDSLESIIPRSNTPTVGALTGGVDFCVDFQQRNPREQCVVVMITDGQPNGCGLDLSCHEGFTPNPKGFCVDPEAESVLAPIVRAGFDTHGVLTYTIGMDGVGEDGFTLLNALAAAGGTDCTPNAAGHEACNVTETGGAGLQIALDNIRETSTQRPTTARCRWTLPTGPGAPPRKAQPLKLHLTTPAERLTPQQVASAADCSGAPHAWHFDSPLTPTELHACPQTCNWLEQTDAATASLEMACR